MKESKSRICSAVKGHRPFLYLGSEQQGIKGGHVTPMFGKFGVKTLVKKWRKNGH